MSTSIRRRPSRSIPSVIVALVLLVAAVGAVWAGVTALSGDGAAGDSVAGAAGTSWSSRTAYLPTVGVALVGVALIITAFIPGHPDAHPIRTDGSTTAQPDSLQYTEIHRSSPQRNGTHDAEDPLRHRHCPVRPLPRTPSDRQGTAAEEQAALTAGERPPGAAHVPGRP